MEGIYGSWNRCPRRPPWPPVRRVEKSRYVEENAATIPSWAGYLRIEELEAGGLRTDASPTVSRPRSGNNSTTARL
jgi:hypothetical protein